MGRWKKKKIVITGLVLIFIFLSIPSIIKISKNKDVNLLIHYYRLRLLIPSVNKPRNRDFINAIKNEDIHSVENLLKENGNLVNLKSDYKSPLEIAIFPSVSI